MKHTGESDSKLILLLGGARAGKSSYALSLARARESVNGSPVCFIATAQALDEDMATRISRHRTQRPGNWMTIEEPYQIDEALRKAARHNIVIVDCLTLFVSNWLLRCDDEEQCQFELRQLTAEFLQLAQAGAQTVICVSNEAGLGVVPDIRLGRLFRDLLGRVNQDFAAAADEVYLLIAGIPLQLKGIA